MQSKQQLEQVENEPMCDLCGNNTAEIFQTVGDFCIECWQKITHSDVSPAV